MVFSSISFLTVFFPLFILIYSLLPKKVGIKNTFILFSSIIFYSWGGPKFIFAILTTTVLDFFLVKIMHQKNNPAQRKLFLFFSVGLNLGLLFIFKYFNFFIDNVNSVSGIFGISSIHLAKIILPIGISFYTFESITYSVDVYRRIHKPLDNFWEYQLYIILFPKLIAGPIVRYHDISDQIKNHVQNETMSNKLSGFIQFCIGLSKKVLIANAMGEQADAVFSMNPLDINSQSAWIGALAYTMQIYFDFSGYSDMAIGIGKIVGFRFPENFNNPYTSTSITDFWRRWHITLGAWMKNYLYIPLGGNKVTPSKLYINLGIVFLMSGLWHGASWNFVFWGAYHGFFLIIERAFLLNALNKAGKIPSILYSFLVVVVGWVFFRLENIHLAFGFVKKMFSFNFNSAEGIVTNNDFDYLIFVALFFSFISLNKHVKSLHDKIFYSGMSAAQYVFFTFIAFVLYTLCLAFVSGSSFNPFIYFRF
ncbi:MAG: MBOAT family protein [Bacteroidetes bacterium]|nr:MBOAT family protein [Bacteroidota bacterium]